MSYDDYRGMWETRLDLQPYVIEAKKRNLDCKRDGEILRKKWEYSAPVLANKFKNISSSCISIIKRFNTPIKWKHC